jgi:catechol 2,3-dioxygenase-like lactoylglutathione lyase family enzyme
MAALAITGAHVLLYTSKPEELRAVFRDVFGWEYVDDGDGWLIFALPPAEIGVHPADAPAHQLSLLCDDVETTSEELRARGLEVGEAQDRGFGIAATLVLPGGVDVLLYEPRHASPLDLPSG